MEPGSRLGTFEITGMLGRGAMGEVFRARDTTLGRDVAIKVLPEAFASNPERLARFEQEARTLASLNHSNVATVHGFEHDADRDVHYLIMELIDGETLGERIAGGPLSLSDALPVFIDIARGLEAAHEAGIVHRDLKPDNVKISADGVVKILDFGLAKSTGVAKAADPDATIPPTSPVAVTAEGMIMGTPSYMSPEMAQGRTIDKRTDIWAFGCCLFEALAGKLPFEGDSIAETLSEIIKKEPDWDVLPDSVPRQIRRLLERCLEKNPRERLRDIGDAAYELSEIARGDGDLGAEDDAPRSRSEGTRWAVGLAAALLIALLSVIIVWQTRESGPIEEVEGLEQAEQPSEARPVRRYSMALDPAFPLASPTLIDFTIALSQDGASMVYVAQTDDGKQLVYRQMDQLEYRVLPGTIGAGQPFFSPDGQWIGFFDVETTTLKKISTQGGDPIILCDATIAAGASWGDDDKIVFASALGTGLLRVSAAGGTPETLTELAEGELAHILPHVLPGSRGVLYVGVKTLDASGFTIFHHNLSTGARKSIASGGSRPVYVPSGHIVYVKAGQMSAIPFDIERLEVTGSEASVTEERMATSESTPYEFSSADDGTLVYIPASMGFESIRALTWVDRNGREELLQLPPDRYWYARFSPDGGRLALMRGARDNIDIWIHNLTDATTTRLTFSPAGDLTPIWTKDGQRIVFGSSRAGGVNIFQKRVDGTEPTSQLTSSDEVQLPYSASMQRDEITFVQFNADTKADIWLLPLEDNATPIPLVQTEANELHPAISTDGRWLAYSSDESGRAEVYVQSLPELTGKWQVSENGGVEPVWSNGGDEIFFRNNAEMMVVGVQTQPEFSAGTPRSLFQTDFFVDPISRTYEVSPDGQRFLVIKELDRNAPNSSFRTELLVVENWFEELKRLAPVSESD